MMNSKQKNVTPLTSEQENLLYNEIDNIEKRLALVYKDLEIKAEELPDMVKMANKMRFPQGDDVEFVRDVREAQRCQQNIKDIEVTHFN